MQWSVALGYLSMTANEAGNIVGEETRLFSPAGSSNEIPDQIVRMTQPVRIHYLGNLSTDELLELAVGRIDRMDPLSLALFSRLVDANAELKTLKERLGAGQEDYEPDRPLT